MDRGFGKFWETEVEEILDAQFRQTCSTTTIAFIFWLFFTHEMAGRAADTPISPGGAKSDLSIAMAVL